jgi:lysozyme
MALLNGVIDLSHHNNVTSFQDVRDAGVIGVIHKATQGVTGVDGTFGTRKPRALAAGLLWGAYHFGASGAPQKQADHFLDVVQPGPTDLLVLDFEPNMDGTMALAEAETFVQRIFQQTGRFPGLYSGQSFLKEQLGSKRNETLANCFLWVARYSDQLPQVPTATWKTFTLWQYTDGNLGPQPHQVNGVATGCDRDKFNGDESGLRNLWGVQPATPPPPTTNS